MESDSNLRSSNMNWSLPVDLSTSGEDGRDPKIVSTAEGGLVCIWHWGTLFGTPWRVQVSSLAPGASRWSAPVDLTDGSRMAFAPQVTMTPDGMLAAIWVGFDGRNLRIHVCTLAPGADRWSTPVMLSDSAPMDANALLWEAKDPQIVATSGGTLAATWSRLDGVWVSTLSDGHTHWSTPSKLADDGTSDGGGPHIVAGPEGSLATIWATFGAVQVSILAASSQSWSAPVDLCDVSGNGKSPQIAATPDGGLVAIWSRPDNGNYRVQVASIADGAGHWSTPADLTSAGEQAHDPQIIATSSGIVAGAWTKWEGGPYSAHNFRVQIAIRAAGTTMWSAPFNLTVEGIPSQRVQLAASAEGTIAAIWLRSDGQHRRVQVATLRMGGTAWSTPIDLSAPGGNAADPQIAAAPDGTLLATWTRNDGTNDRVQVSTLRG